MGVFSVLVFIAKIEDIIHCFLMNACSRPRSHQLVADQPQQPLCNCFPFCDPSLLAIMHSFADHSSLHPLLSMDFSQQPSRTISDMMAPHQLSRCGDNRIIGNWPKLTSLQTECTKSEPKHQNIIIGGRWLWSEVNFLEFYVVCGLVVEERVIEDTHYFEGGAFEVCELLLLIQLANLLLSLPVLVRIKEVIRLGLKPAEQLLIGFIGVYGIKNISFSAQEAINLIARLTPRTCLANHAQSLKQIKL